MERTPPNNVIIYLLKMIQAHKLAEKRKEVKATMTSMWCQTVLHSGPMNHYTC